MGFVRYVKSLYDSLEEQKMLFVYCLFSYLQYVVKRTNNGLLWVPHPPFQTTLSIFKHKVNWIDLVAGNNQLQDQLHFWDVLEFLRSSWLASEGREYRWKIITFSCGLLVTEIAQMSTSTNVFSVTFSWHVFIVAFCSPLPRNVCLPFLDITINPIQCEQLGSVFGPRCSSASIHSTSAAFLWGFMTIWQPKGVLSDVWHLASGQGQAGWGFCTVLIRLWITQLMPKWDAYKNYMKGNKKIQDIGMVSLGLTVCYSTQNMSWTTDGTVFQ